MEFLFFCDLSSLEIINVKLCAGLQVLFQTSGSDQHPRLVGAYAMALASAPNAVMLYNVGDATASHAMSCHAMRDIVF